MSPDRPSIDERLAAFERANRPPAAAPTVASPAYGPAGGSVVAYTSPPLTWKQMGKFFLGVALLLVVSIGGWRFLRECAKTLLGYRQQARPGTTSGQPVAKPNRKS